MATETTIRVICDRCGDVVYNGPQGDRPSSVANISLWSGSRFDWDPQDLCPHCGEGLKATMDNYVQTPPDEVERMNRSTA